MDLPDMYSPRGRPASHLAEPLQDPSPQLRFLNAYFERIHPLKCLAFVHKPSFMYSLDRGTLLEDYAAPLVDIMCALGAR
jgi:hypothetical protein